MNKKLLSKFIKADNFYILSRINVTMHTIIRLKNENRSIGQRIKALCGEVTKLTLHIAKENTNNKGNLRKRHSYCNLIRILEESQKHKSKLILKHRNKIQELRKELV